MRLAMSLQKWSRLLRSLLVLLLLVIAQQGAILHALSHYAPTEFAGDSKKHAPRGDLCEQCLAFAQVGGVALTLAFTVLTTAGLSHERALTNSSRVELASHVAARSRGPPSYL